MEYLTKSQIMLLALLIAIVSSVTSAIVTISLLGQSPPTVATSVNNIIQKTVEQVVTGTTTGTLLQPVKPVVAISVNTAASSIATVQKSVIRIVIQGDAAAKLVARGVIVSARGTAITDAGSLDPTFAYEAILPSSARVAVTQNAATSSGGFAYITLRASTTTPTFIPATFADPQKVTLGTNVIRLGGTLNDIVSQGIITALPDNNSGTVQADASSGVPGAVLINFSGEVIGMTTQHSLALGQNYYSLLNTK